MVIVFSLFFRKLYSSLGSPQQLYHDLDTKVQAYIEMARILIMVSGASRDSKTLLPTPEGWSLANIPQVCQFRSRLKAVCPTSPKPYMYFDGRRVDIWRNWSLKANPGKWESQLKTKENNYISVNSHKVVSQITMSILSWVNWISKIFSLYTFS